MFKRKKSHKQNIHNPNPKKYKYDSTWKESYKAAFMEEIEQKYIEREKNNQQREHKDDQLKHKLEKKKWHKDKMKKIMRQPLIRAERDLFLQVRSITREEIFPKIVF